MSRSAAAAAMARSRRGAWSRSSWVAGWDAPCYEAQCGFGTAGVALEFKSLQRRGRWRGILETSGVQRAAPGSLPLDKPRARV